MKNKCKFCKTGELNLIYQANNKNPKKKTADQFACTNCGYGEHGPIVKCANCEIIFVDEPISQQEINDYYKISEDPLYLAEQKARKATFTHYLNKLGKKIGKKGKLLDIGTNTGLFVKVAKDSGWNASGLEPNKEAVAFAKKNFNLDLISKPFEENSIPKESYEVVTMWDVIEHFTDPISELKKVYQTLKPNGVFAFSTVDPESLVAKIRGSSWPWYMEMHRVLLSPKVVEHYLKQSGFKEVTFTPHFRFFSLGYAAKMLGSIHPVLGNVSSKIVNTLGISKILVPFYANDLYDCYAFK